MAYNAELQMLREFAWLHMPQINCCFCGEPLLPWPDNNSMTFGHRRHSKIHVKYTVHHENRNREDNLRSNLKDSHSKCHDKHHAAERIKEKYGTEVLDSDADYPEVVE